MYIEKLYLADVRYNPELEGFEALVEIRDKTGSYAYPTHIKAPMNADFKMIARSLTQKARKTHLRPDPALRLRKAVQTAARPDPMAWFERLRAGIAA
ncbi:hypothetical protein PEL8287_01195 [Roseovarius litorisediminis]|uniref:Uncharacterized protein n=1 Tax=Roseovarius litorisediminis TaxID=1312363 RepID=A0A1Y5RZ46_9RHOB|nr:hypothetical protein [Roseovarius litorisediminis]SLN25900.1 hypothetical protein PEL8287_01195 [Roseovarius litorisediminis]